MSSSSDKSLISVEKEISIDNDSITISLDKVCYKCMSLDFTKDLNDMLFQITVENCSSCNNKRYELTQAGRAILDLVKRHL